MSGAVNAWDKMDGVWGIPGAVNTGGEDAADIGAEDMVRGGGAGAMEGSGAWSGAPPASPSSTVSMSCHISWKSEISELMVVTVW